ncbi:anthocyanidin 3-O-glucosyltransferase UFGT-like [Coffea arabica]|uniref:Anthocyanidin 3-O-glucosyltransferase UFGT-like n=1 Tax=Coffea arabica TaxID=13443 RepID=A0A6P6UN11_COFAR|nr:anthocyanidin 3-O-glucosyltransferase 2-like [Coffea arabica]
MPSSFNKQLINRDLGTDVQTGTQETPFFSTAKSNASLFSSSSMFDDDNIKAYDVPDGVPDGYVFAGRPLEDIDLFFKVAPENFRRAAEAAERDTGRRVSCVVADAFLWFSFEIAEARGVSWVPVWTSEPRSLSIHFYTGYHCISQFDSNN